MGPPQVSKLLVSLGLAAHAAAFERRGVDGPMVRVFFRDGGACSFGMGRIFFWDGARFLLGWGAWGWVGYDAEGNVDGSGFGGRGHLPGA